MPLPLRRLFSCFLKWGLLTLLFVGYGSFPPPALADGANAIASPESFRPYLNRAIAKVTEFQLNNGLRFIVMENHEAPVVSFYTLFDVGGVDEPEGKTGVAHFLEHMAFKGTETIGTTDYLQEKQVLAQLDDTFEQLKIAKANDDRQKAETLEVQFAELQSKAGKLVERNEFGEIIQTAGGVGLNAATGTDATFYYYSLPSNKLELWMSLESERFLNPVFREFYKEQQVILEERRMRTENNPVGTMVEAFLAEAFTQHPYRRPVIGYDQDIRNLSRQDVSNFYREHYVASNMTIAIVGDVNVQQVQQMAHTYFDRFPSRPKPVGISVTEPPQRQSKQVALTLPSQPWYFEGYHRPSMADPDNAVYDTITTILSRGRTSRLYQSLVEQQQVALVAQGFNGFPGEKYPNLILFYAQSTPETSLDELGQALHQEVTRLITEPVATKELERAKNLLQTRILRSLDSNRGMAERLVKYQVLTGDWRNLFAQIEAIATITPADIQRVAQQIFRPENRTEGRIIPDQTQVP